MLDFKFGYQHKSQRKEKKKKQRIREMNYILTNFVTLKAFYSFQIEYIYIVLVEQIVNTKKILVKICIQDLMERFVDFFRLFLVIKSN